MAATCPKCGYPEVEGDSCPRCRVVVSKYQLYLRSGVYQQSLGKGVKVPRAGAGAPAPPGPSRSATAGALSPAAAQAPAQAGVPPSQAGPATARAHRLSFHGTGGSLFGIYIVNLLLTLITLGIYSFWGRVKVRKYLLSETEFESDRFAYHGTAKELLIGTLKAALVFGVPIGLLSVVRDVLQVGPVIKVMAAVLIYALVIVFIPFAMVSARRYRLSRISWREIRFSLRGPAWDFIKLFISGTILGAITLTLYYPFLQTKMYAFMTSYSYFGNRKLEFDGRGKDLFRSYVLALLLTLPTLGLYWVWFVAKKRRYFAEHTSFATARFRSTVTGGRLLRLYLGNLLLLLPLGLGLPWVLVRTIRFNLTHLTLEGALDLEGIVQEPQIAPALGEGFASFLDIGFDLG
jgi:uncharacterized membrane protein YjgN (DUF898 family)